MNGNSTKPMTDEYMDAILDALKYPYECEIPEGFKSIDEICAAQGGGISHKQMNINLNNLVRRGKLEKKMFGRLIYYRAVKE